MNPDTFSSTKSNFSSTKSSPLVASPSTQNSSRLESVAFLVLLITTILAPLAFLPTQYIVIDAVKTVLIAIGTLISAILYGIMAYKERSITLPPKSIIWTSILVAASLIVSAYWSLHSGKSLFGQGFELNTVSFLLVMFLAGLVTYVIVQRKSERATVLYIGMTVPFIILAILHGLRLIFGASFMSLGVLSSVTSSLVGTWFDLGVYAIVILLISLCALMFLSLSRKVKIIYWILLMVSFVSAVIINSSSAWLLGAIVLAIVTIVTTSL
ncbi:MAG: hypothetical protein RL536_165, partial [Candidatus Parcubacteria bacterium]